MDGIGWAELGVDPAPWRGVIDRPGREDFKVSETSQECDRDAQRERKRHRERGMQVGRRCGRISE